MAPRQGDGTPGRGGTGEAAEDAASSGEAPGAEVNDERTYAERKATDGAAVMRLSDVLVCLTRGHHHPTEAVPAECGDCGSLLDD